VGGHYSAGEGVEGGLREIHEELGLHVTLEQLRHAGWHREEVFHENGLIDREIQDVYFLMAEVDLAALAPAAEEVSAVALVPLSELRSLLDGRSTPVPAPSVFAGGELTRLLLNRADLVPRRDGYYERVVRFAQRLPNTEPLRRRWW
jgi:8-oxo-dGTP pyrophosphatase MutT (NUDIX family)